MARPARTRTLRAPLPVTRAADARLGARAEHWIETDRYDRATFERLIVESPALDVVDSGAKLLPHFRGFVLYLFAILFKLNLVLLRDDAVRPSAGFYRLVLTHICANPGVAELRALTAMDETRAGLATVLLAERLLALLKSEPYENRRLSSTAEHPPQLGSIPLGRIGAAGAARQSGIGASCGR